MKKIIITLFISTGFFMPATAQKDAKAKDLLNKTAAILAQAGGISASFTLNIKDGMNETSQACDGTILMKGDKFIINMPEQAIYFDGKTQWIYQKSGEEVSITQPSGEEMQALNPKSIFANYKKTDYRYAGTKTDGKKRKVQEVILFPKQGDISKITIQINAAGFPVSFFIFYKNKIESKIHINKYLTKQNFSDSLFVFDGKQYPNAEIIDLR
ncbi:MAG: outer-membrane lipoprotein carrier protein LolA [Dysgonamonadaceae bacterium]|jgi:outer membrane lipoprotein-sorting protein|nr:outer-membrane lipoprotein carrier protein LolA [Dysgonamonadaceae bacterium]